MKQGRTLTELAQELERQVKSKRDFKAPTNLLKTVCVDAGIALRVGDQGSFAVTTNTAHDQIGGWAGIPSKYYDRMLNESPELLTENLNHWFQAKPETRLVRTLDGRARGFLSNRYRTIDNWDVANAALPILQKNKVQIVSTEVTESRLYIKAVTDKLTYEVKKGDVVQAGIVISNSEIGLGAVKVEPLLFRLTCLNGAVIADSAMRRFHIGRHSEELETAYEVFSDETRRADDKAFYLKLQDVVRSAFDEVKFKTIKGATVDATTRRIEAKKVDPVVEQVVEHYHLPEDMKASILGKLIEDGDLTQWGLANAITWQANDLASYERATELERIGGEVMMLPKPNWERLITTVAA